MLQASRIASFAIGALVAATVGITAPAHADELVPESVTALDVVPGLTDNVTTSTETALIKDAVGFEALGAAGLTTRVERLGAQSAAVAHSEGGQTLIENTSASTDTVVQQLPGGGRIIEVIGAPDAPREFTYHVDVPDGMTIAPQDDGSLLIGSETRNGDTITMEVDGLVGAPWAVDANGISVPAFYEVLGDGTVTMHVEHDDDVAYPVVADPTYTGGGFRVTWNVLTPHLVTAQLNKARTADAEDGGAAVCVLIAFVPVVGTIVAAICGLHNVAIRATSRYGYCQQWALNLVSRSFSVGLYKGGWCS